MAKEKKYAPHVRAGEKIRKIVTENFIREEKGSDGDVYVTYEMIANILKDLLGLNDTSLPKAWISGRFTKGKGLSLDKFMIFIEHYRGKIGLRSPQDVYDLADDIYDLRLNQRAKRITDALIDDYYTPQHLDLSKEDLFTFTLLGKNEDAWRLATGVRSLFDWDAQKMDNEILRVALPRTMPTRNLEIRKMLYLCMQAMDAQKQVETKQAMLKLGGLPDSYYFDTNSLTALWECDPEPWIKTFTQLNLLQPHGEAGWRTDQRVLMVLKDLLRKESPALTMKAEHWQRRMVKNMQLTQIWRERFRNTLVSPDQIFGKKTFEKGRQAAGISKVNLFFRSLKRFFSLGFVDSDWEQFTLLSGYATPENYLFARHLRKRSIRNDLFGRVLALCLAFFLLLTIWVDEKIFAAVPMLAILWLTYFLSKDVYKVNLFWDQLWDDEIVPRIKADKSASE